jgi:hypothetical protein
MLCAFGACAGDISPLYSISLQAQRFLLHRKTNERQPTSTINSQHPTPRHKQQPWKATPMTQQSKVSTRQVTLDNKQQTSNNYHQQIHPTNKTNTRQQITVKRKCEKSTILT